MKRVSALWQASPRKVVGALFILMLAGYGALGWFARPRGAVQFNEHNAIDVESMGLYWHFVDIVWIVIFTAVYLIEFI